MYQFAWAKEVLNYLKDNEGLINQLELAFADLRKTTTGLSPYGTIDEGISPDCYIWQIHDHALLIRVGVERAQPTLWIEAIKPVDSGAGEQT
ncbi:hypothetical protein KFU94_26765 [Chloroflexi bacterium TSY]|nr:hypothetical protein [Chloroflexi bacterium TSY]